MHPGQLPTVVATEVPDGATILDVREDDEWAAGHIAGSTHVPLSQLPVRAADVPDTGPLVVVGGGGGGRAPAPGGRGGRGGAAPPPAGGGAAGAGAGRPLVTDAGTPGTVL